MPYFNESVEQSSSSELSDELITALAAGRWWAIMEVSDPISAYGDTTSWQWCETVEEFETSCPTSLVFSDSSENVQSLHSGFSDATPKSTKQWRQKQGEPLSGRSTKGAPVPTRFQQGAPVLVSSEMGKLTPSQIFSDASEKAMGSSFSGTSIMTRDQRRKQSQKKPQEPPMAARSSQGTPIPAAFPQEPHMPPKSPHGTPLPEQISKWQQLKILERREEMLQQKPLASTLEPSAQVPGNVEESIGQSRQKLKIPEPLRQEQLEQKPYVCFLQGAPVLKNIPEKKKLKISEPLRQPLASFLKGAQTPQEAAVPARSLQAESVPAESAALPARKILRARRRLAENLRKKLLNAPVPVSFTQGAPMPSRISKGVSEHSGAPDVPHIPADPKESIGQSRQKLKIPEPLRQEQLKQKPYVCFLQGAPVLKNIPEKKKLTISEPLRQPLASFLKGAQTPQKAAVPARSLQAPAALAQSAELHTQKILRARRRLAENMRENLQH